MNVPSFSCSNLVASSERSSNISRKVFGSLWAVWSQISLRYSLLWLVRVFEVSSYPKVQSRLTAGFESVVPCTSGAVLPFFPLLMLATSGCKSLFSVWRLPDTKGVKVATYSGPLAHLCCGRKVRTLQMPLACVGSTCSGWTTWELPQPKRVHLPGPSCPVSWVLHKGQLQVGCVSPQEWSQAVTLLEDLSHPGSQEGVGSDWQSTHMAWLQMQSLELVQWLLVFCLQLSHTCLSVSRAINDNWIIPFSIH